MTSIWFIMGPTCSGKSTFLRTAEAYFKPGDLGLVEVGKMMRAKYPPEYFKGQAAPSHTAREAWEMCSTKIDEHRTAGKRIVLVDGQPRDGHQALKASVLYPNARYLWLSASLEVRRARGESTRDPEEFKTLTEPRLTNDMIQHYETMWSLVMMDKADRIVAVPTANPDGKDPAELFGTVLGYMQAGIRSGR